MPLIERNIKVISKTIYDLTIPKTCCPQLGDYMKKGIAILSGSGLKVGSLEVKFCPFCGDKVGYRDTMVSGSEGEI
jgi:hypothetical protein